MKILPITSIIVTYLFICGGLNLLGYWGTFNFDPFPLIQIWDIQKNAIFPFLMSNGLGLFVAFCFLFINSPTVPFKLQERGDWAKLLSFAAFLTATIIFAVTKDSFAYNLKYWTLTSLFIGVFMAIEIAYSTLIIRITKNSAFRIALGIVISMSPILSFVLGKKMAIGIHENKIIKIVIIRNKETKSIMNDTISLKLLGFLGDKFIVSSFDNDKIFVLNQSAFDVIELQGKKEDKY